MAKEVRSTIYLQEDLYELFREACNIKFGDKQGKIKKGIIMAVNNFVNETLGEQAKAVKPVEAETPQQENNQEQELVDIHIETKPPQDVVEEPEVTQEVPQDTMVSKADPPLILAKPSYSAKDVAKEIIEESIVEGDRVVNEIKTTTSELDQVPNETPQQVVEAKPRPEPVEIKEDTVSVLAKKLAEERRKRGM